MILTSIACICFFFCLLLQIFFGTKWKNTKHVKRKLWLFCVLFCIVLCVWFSPIYDGVSLAKLMYSCFDSVSLFTFVLACAFCVKEIFSLCSFWREKSYALHAYFLQIRFHCSSAFVLLVYGIVLYGGALGILPFDIYHIDSMQQGLMCLLFVLLLYACNHVFGVLGLFSLCLFIVFGGENVSVLECFICPYLLLYCGVYLVYIACRHIYTLYSQFICNLKSKKH